MIVRRVLRGRFRQWRNALVAPVQGGRGRARHKRAAVIVIAAMSVVSYLGFRALLDMMVAAGATSAELGATLGAALSASLVALLVFDLDAVAATLLLDRDLGLLRAAPIPPRAIFALKLLDAAPRTLLPLVVLALPALAAYASVCALTPLAWLALPPIAACLWVLALGLGFAVVLPLLAAAPVHRVREALGLIATLTVTALWLVNALALPRLVDEGPATLDRLRAGALHSGGASAWSPGHHAARLVLALHEQAWRDAALGLLLLLAVTVVAALLAASIASRLLPRVLARVAAPPSLERAPRPRADPAHDRPRGILRAALARDARLLSRDWTALADVVTAAALWTLLPLISRAMFGAGAGLLARTMLAALAVGLGYELGARALPFERRGAAWMVLAPVPPRRWLLAKLAGIAIVAAPILLAATLAVSFSMRLGPAQALGALGYGASAFVLSAGIGLWTGARFADLRWTHHRAMLTLSGRLAAAGFMIVQLTVWVGVAAIEQTASGSPVGTGLGWMLPLAALTLAILPIVAAGRLIPRFGSEA